MPYAEDELVVVSLIRDARPYLKFFVEHYFSLGVKHIVFLDNGSTDGTVEALKNYDNVTVLRSELFFKDYLSSMKRYLVTRFGRGRWILYVDQDELFDYPYSDVVSLSSLLRYLTEKSYTAVVAQMLDMFPEKPLEGRAGNSKDEPLKELHRFYDISRVRIRDKMKELGRRRNNVVKSEEIAVYKGGIREIIFNLDAFLTKHPLMFLDGRLKPMEFPAPSHWVDNAKVADITCVLFHYKFLDEYFHKQLDKQIARLERENPYHLSRGLERRKKYLEALDRNPSLGVKQETSKELKGVNDLLEDGFLVVSEDYLSWVDAEEERSILRAAATQGKPTELVEAFLKFRRQERVKTLKMQRVGQQQFSDRARIRALEQQLKSIRASRTWKLMKMISRIKARALSLGRNSSRTRDKGRRRSRKGYSTNEDG